MNANPHNRNIVKDLVSKLNVPEDYIRFGLALMKACYLKYGEKKPYDFG